MMELDRNERVHPLPEWFLEAIRQSLQSTLLTRYPSQDAVHQQLATQLGLLPEQVLLTAGSDAAIKALYHAYVRPGDTVVMLDPSYAMYPVYARMFQARICSIAFDESLVLDVARLVRSVVPGVRLVMLANPNQPTGTLLPEPVLRDLAERTQEVGALLAVDEAYYPFSRTTVLPWIREMPHVVVVRTFSKAAGLAGLRIGFVVGHAQVLANLFKVRSTYDVNSLAILCASQILAHPEIIEDYVAEVEAGKQVLAQRAEALDLVPLPSAANFLLLRVAHRCEPARLVEALRLLGCLVKGPFSAPGLCACIRVTLGPPALMEAFAGVLAQVITDMTTTQETAVG